MDTLALPMKTYQVRVTYIIITAMHTIEKGCISCRLSHTHDMRTLCPDSLDLLHGPWCSRGRRRATAAAGPPHTGREHCLARQAHLVYMFNVVYSCIFYARQARLSGAGADGGAGGRVHKRTSLSEEAQGLLQRAVRACAHVGHESMKEGEGLSAYASI